MYRLSKILFERFNDTSSYYECVSFDFLTPRRLRFSRIIYTIVDLDTDEEKQVRIEELHAIVKSGELYFSMDYRGSIICCTASDKACRLRNYIDFVGVFSVDSFLYDTEFAEWYRLNKGRYLSFDRIEEFGQSFNRSFASNVTSRALSNADCESVHTLTITEGDTLPSNLLDYFLIHRSSFYLDSEKLCFKCNNNRNIDVYKIKPKFLLEII